MSNSSLARTRGEFSPDSSSSPDTSLQAQDSVQLLERIHDRMRERICNALAPHRDARFKYRMQVRGGRIAVIVYRLTGANSDKRYEIDKIVSAAVIEGSGVNSGNASGISVVQWVRLTTEDTANLGDIDVK